MTSFRVMLSYKTIRRTCPSSRLTLSTRDRQVTRYRKTARAAVLGDVPDLINEELRVDLSLERVALAGQ